MGPEAIILVILWSALTLYLLFGGADFGVGVWEVNTALQATERDRNLLYKAIGPVWEANHVWLIFFIVVMHAAFPRAYAALGQALWVPLLIAIVGIVFRGAAYAFRSNLLGRSEQRAIWEAVFAVASTVAPFFLGAAAGAVASANWTLTMSVNTKARSSPAGFRRSRFSRASLPSACACFSRRCICYANR